MRIRRDGLARHGELPATPPLQELVTVGFRQRQVIAERSWISLAGPE
jgi:hypothetical protein